MGEVGIVWRKELLDILRDRRTIMAMIVVPLLVYPMLIIVISQVGIAQVEKLRASQARVAVIPANASSALIGALQADTSIVLVATESPEADLLDREIDAVLRVPADLDRRLEELEKTEISVRVDLSRDRGERMRDRLRGFLRDWRADLVAGRLQEEDLSEAFVRPFDIEVHNVAGERKMGGSVIGKILPFLLVVMMMTGAFYPAIDVTAGERERGTLETLLVAPASRFNIVMGKFLTVFVASIVTTLANIVSIAFTVFFLIGSINMGGDATAGFAALIDWRAFILIFLIMIPMAILFSGLSMLVASFARSFKEAQNYLSPMMIACMAPAYLSFVPGVEIDRIWALVPVANVVLLSRELLLGNYAWPFFAMTMATMSALALLLLHRTVSLFGGELMLGGEGAPRMSLRQLFRREPGRRAEVLTPGTVAPIFLLVLLGFFYIGTPLQLWNLKAGLVITQILVIAGIPIVAMRVLGIPVAPSLGIQRRPRPALILWAIWAAPAATLLAALTAMGQGLFMQTPDSYREMMEQLFAAEGEVGLLTAILIFAVVPALCEETLFRGFVLRGLARRLSPAAAIFWTALLFGAFHFDLYRLLPTAVLGLVLGAVVWMTGSLWPAVALHAANNTIAVLANNVEQFRSIPWLQEGGSIPPLVVAVVALMGVSGFLGLLRARSQGEPFDDLGAAPDPVDEEEERLPAAGFASGTDP